MIIPAMDLLQNKVVRLYQGDYDQAKFYDIKPLELVSKYQQSQADVIHIIDLEGARNEENRQIDLISHVVQERGGRFQVGGGIRSERDVADLLKIGVERVILGSLAIKQPAKISKWIDEFGPDHIVLALDVSIDEAGNRWLPTKGWRQQSGMRLEEILFMYEGVKHVLCTDINRDGTLTGSNTELYSELVKVYSSIEWQASGGIGSLLDIEKVAKTGVSGAIVGKALLDGVFSLEEAMACWQEG
jgi:phosphoribosylformimino-5-aminoimidazole carboxamide ribotide isomerase